MKIAVRIIPWIILAVPFVVLAFFYDSIENQILVARSFFGDETIYAPKSLFTVFRVPLIEIVCAAAIETIRPQPAATAANPDYFSIWNVLLYTIALKSLFQVFEFISLSVFHSPARADFFFYITLATVIGGICLVIGTARKGFSDYRRRRRDSLASGRKKILMGILLGILLAAYFILALLPVFIYKAT